MEKKSGILFSIGWIINIIILLVIIVIPKDNALFNSLYYVFVIGVFFLPGLLIGGQCVQKCKNNSDENNKLWLGISSLGTSAIILLNFVNFINTIKKEFVSQVIVILLTFVSVELLLGYLNITIKPNNRKYIFISIAIYITLVLFYFCVMIMSYDHSKVW